MFFDYITEYLDKITINIQIFDRHAKIPLLVFLIHSLSFNNFLQSFNKPIFPEFGLL